MSQIRELLERQAAALDDSHHTAREGEVRDRIRAVRRRRAAVGTATVVAVLAAAGVIVLPGLGDRAQTPASLVGRTVPQATDSLGYRFRYADSVVGDHGTARLHLAASSQPRLLRWASAGNRGQLALSTGTEPPWVGPAGGFGAFALLPSGARVSSTLRLSGVRDPGDVAIAVYDLKHAAPGVSVQGLTYRKEVEGRSLLGAGIGRLGQAEVSFRASASSSRTARLEIFCSAAAQGRRVEVTTYGQKPGAGSWIGCSDEAASYDLAPGSSVNLDARDLQDATEGVRVRLVDTKGHPVQAGPKDRIGAAVYETGTGEPAVPSELDVDGHRWLRSMRYASERGSRTASASVSGIEGRSLAWWSVDGSGGLAKVRIGGASVSQIEVRGGGRGSSSVQRNGGYTVDVNYARAPEGRTYLAIFEPAD